MTVPLRLDPMRLFPTEGRARGLAAALYAEVAEAPIVSPHGHTEPAWWAGNDSFPDPAALFVTPDHYVQRMLVSQGASHADFTGDPRAVWRRFAEGYHLFRGTPTRLWLDHAFAEVFGMEVRLGADTADLYFDALSEKLAQPGFRPRALYALFGLEAIATTDGALSDLAHHRAVRGSGWDGRVLPTYRPDAVCDPDTPGFAGNVEKLGALTGEDATTWRGYLAAHRARRAAFRALGATATDHGAPSPRTLNLEAGAAEKLFDAVLAGKADAAHRDAFRAQMLTEFARMSCEDGLVMQLHAGSIRNHAPAVFERYGPDKGFDIPAAADFTNGLKPLLDAVGLDDRLTLILFTLDETAYARELAPLAGAYPSLLLGPPWWFHDSVEGMRRFRSQAMETAGIYNTAGFNDDARCLATIGARHDVCRRVDCGWLALLVAEGRLDEDEAFETAPLLAHGLARRAYGLEDGSC